MTIQPKYIQVFNKVKVSVVINHNDEVHINTQVHNKVKVYMVQGKVKAFITINNKQCPNTGQ